MNNVDVDGVRRVLSGYTTAEVKNIIGQIDGLLSGALPVEEISDLANRYFENEDDCREWLADIQRGLKASGHQRI